MDNHLAFNGYADRLKAFRKSDIERDALFSEIVASYEQLRLKHDELYNDLASERVSRRQLQTTATETERELQELKQISSSNSFVLCLIDGDAALFQDNFYAMGREGGAEAAFRLHSAIQTDLKKRYPEANVNDWNVIAQIYLNVQGLAYQLQSRGIINNATCLMEFGRSFGISQPLFSFIDVGSGKEHADYKLRSTLTVLMPMVHNRHSYFIPCHDNGYLPVLQAYRRSSKLTLIETRPAEPGFVDLNLPRISLPDLFRADNLPPKAITPSSSAASARGPLGAQPSGPLLVRPASPAPSTDLVNTSSWATVGKTSSGSKTISIAPKSTTTTQRKFVVLNVNDQRLDSELSRLISAADRQSFNARMQEKGKFCNSFHLIGRCEAGKYCDYQHGDKLSPGELVLLKQKARMRACALKGYCRELDCTFGHSCTYGRDCPFDACWLAFSHSYDLKPVKRVFEDGSEERV